MGRRWLTNAFIAGVTSAVIGALGTIGAAYAGRQNCPPADYCDSLIKTVGPSGKAQTTAMQAAFERCLGHHP